MQDDARMNAEPTRQGGNVFQEEGVQARDRAGSAIRRPPRVLVVLELGSNWGHLLRIRPVAEALSAKGYELVVAATDVESAKKLWDAAAIAVVQCPGAALKSRGGPRRRVDCYAQILDRLVFGDEAELQATLAAWDSLLADLRPDVLLADFAPIAPLVAHLHRLPLVRFNSGWEVPPFDGCLPITRRSGGLGRAEIMALEAAMVERINHACERHDASGFTDLGELLAVGTQLLSTWPELDHFAPRPSGSYIGPIFSSAHGRDVHWPPTAAAGTMRGKRVLLYLAKDLRNFTIIESLQRLGVSVIAVLPQLRPEAMPHLSRINWIVSDSPVKLAAVLPEADLIISNGGHGLVAAGLLAGVPFLLFPLTFEQALITRIVAKSGAAWSLVANDGVRRSEERIAAMLNDPAPRMAAAVIAQKYRGYEQSQAMARVLEAVDAAAGRAANQI